MATACADCYAQASTTRARNHAIDLHPAIDQLSAAIHADAALQRELGAIHDHDRFVGRMAMLAHETGGSLPQGVLEERLATSPHDPTRQRIPGRQHDRLPPPGWLPVDLIGIDDEIHVQWLWFGSEPPGDPFFEQSVIAAWQRPLNRLADWLTPIAALDALHDEPAPDGLVFHMSRCGSTLAAQVIGALPSTLVIAEPPVFDIALRLARQGLIPMGRVRLLLSALLRPGDPARGHRFAKLDAWHALSLPLFRALFPETPWVFLYREPVEVLASQERQPGLHMVPGMIPFDLYGLIGADAVDPVDFSAWVLERVCAAALDGMALGGGALVNYTQLPAAIAETILPHFGVRPGEREFLLMGQAAARNSKHPESAFVPDGEDKRNRASEAVRQQAVGPIAQTYARLERMRLAQAGADG